MKPADKAKTAERTAKPAAARVLLLVPSRTYRAADFLTAAARLGLDLVVGSDGALPLGGRPVVHADPSDPRGSASRLVAATGPVDAVVAADTPMLVLAAAVAARLGLAHNPVEAVIAATDKAVQRHQWAAAAVASRRSGSCPPRHRKIRCGRRRSRSGSRVWSRRCRSAPA